MNKKVKVQINSIEEFENSFLMNGNFYPKKLCYKEKNYLIMPEWLAIEKKVKYKFVFNIPEHIVPIYNQKIMNELKYESEQK